MGENPFENPETIDIVLSLRFVVKEVERLLASIISSSDYFQSREELLTHLAQEIVLNITKRQPTETQYEEARKAIEKFIPELARRLE